jgi:hypothetical protein
MTQPFSSRNISIQESSIGSAIVSGDRNIVYVINQTFDHKFESFSGKNVSRLGLNPYKGLAAFKESDADLYFGRELLVDRLWQRFQRICEQSVTPRVLTMLGPSGCGKSSLARAGLIPEFARRSLPGKEILRVAVLVPGTQPIEALAGVLAKAITNDPIPLQKVSEVAKRLSSANSHGEFDGLQYVSTLIPEIQGSPLVILVDQFEEIYSLCKDKDNQRIFIENLLYAAGNPTGYVSVVITLRSDFLGETQRHPALNSLIGSDQGEIIPALSRTELRRAIVQPAIISGRNLEESTVDLLIKDAQDREGALPLLQFALSQLWESSSSGQNTTNLYHEMGGVGGALVGKAQEIYEKLNTAEQRIARRVFTRLVHIGKGTPDTRQKIAVSQLSASRDEREVIKSVIYLFSAPEARMLTLANYLGEETIEITHEALISYWQLLSQWVDQDRALLLQKQQIEDSAFEWEAGGRQSNQLLEGFLLTKAIEFNRQQSETFPLSDKPAKTFIQSSIRRRRLSRFRALGFLIIPALIGVGVLEHNIRENRVKTDLSRLDQKGTYEERAAIESLLEGCHRKTRPGGIFFIPERVPRYFVEHLFGNCRSLSYADLEKANLSSIWISEADLRHANMRGANLQNTKFFKTDLRGADLRGANAQGVDFSSADLRGADLRGADLRDAQFSTALLTYDYSGVTRRRYNDTLLDDEEEFSPADLSSTDLRYAEFISGDFQHVNFQNSDLSFAELKLFSKFQSANFEDAILLNTRIEPLGEYDDPHNTLQDPSIIDLDDYEPPFLCNIYLQKEIEKEIDVDRNRDCSALASILPKFCPN